MPPPPPPPKTRAYESSSTDEDEPYPRKPKPRSNLQQPRSREPIYANNEVETTITIFISYLFASFRYLFLVSVFCNLLLHGCTCNCASMFDYELRWQLIT